MLDYKDFRQILDNTAQLTESIKTCPKEDIEEVQMRIDSNVHALQIMISKIEDPDMKTQFKSIMESLTKNVCFVEADAIRSRKKHQKYTEDTSLIDEELLKNAMHLKTMAKRFGSSLSTDRTILQKVGDKMLRNSEESQNSLRILETVPNSVKPATVFLLALLLFFIMYFVIRFT